jgi:hypothetical protein
MRHASQASSETAESGLAPIVICVQLGSEEAGECDALIACAADGSDNQCVAAATRPQSGEARAVIVQTLLRASACHRAMTGIGLAAAEYH